MRAIPFTKPATRKLYREYLKRTRRVIAPLPRTDRMDILMEINSHIFEGFTRESTTEETVRLREILQQLGAPEEVFKPLLAEKTLQKATRPFHPARAVKAIVLNVSNGFGYLLFAVLYLSVFGFAAAAYQKMIYPDQVGIFFKQGSFHLLGIVRPEARAALGLVEVVGPWFIPLMLIFMVAAYLIIALLHRLKSRLIL
ncbi:HAAS signaling domain-containing protein [Lewinella sp. IMCC34191]|uniref:HAAS signaling domain-containing protein n=1 Tax=Lewinella sp. IMCC34191 TaxID=2259172 RepID=UPI000E235741|nr:DUF1700 domain-containing protein [Lewinella sp. IMCC34191]